MSREVLKHVAQAQNPKPRKAVASDFVRTKRSPKQQTPKTVIPQAPNPKTRISLSTPKPTERTLKPRSPLKPLIVKTLSPATNPQNLYLFEDLYKGSHKKEASNGRRFRVQVGASFDPAVGLQVQQFLDEWHCRGLHSGLASRLPLGAFGGFELGGAGALGFESAVLGAFRV